VGLTENPTALQRWIVCGPEFARLLREFQDQYLPETDSNDGKPLTHHESGIAAQKTFQQQVQKLADAMKALGNPFQGDIEELVNIETGDCASETITKNSLPLRSDCNLFSRLYIATQHRSGDLDEFFTHENQPCPPSLSEFGNLRLGKKSDLLACVKPAEQPDPPLVYDCKIFDNC